jgi:integral membrane protein (TIGR01906 family)
MRRGTPARLAETALAALLWVVLCVGSAALALTVPVYTSALVQALGVPHSSGLSVADTLHLSGEVRRLVSDTTYDPLPSTWKGQPAFDTAAVSHLHDVRSVISGARLVTGGGALLLAAYVAACLAWRRFDRLRGGMLAAAWTLAIVVVAAVAAASADFEALFARFHSLFFASGTWTFPADSMLIRLFPEPFWIASGACWAALVLGAAALLALVGRRLLQGRDGMSASRTAANV